MRRPAKARKEHGKRLAAEILAEADKGLLRPSTPWVRGLLTNLGCTPWLETRTKDNPAHRPRLYSECKAQAQPSWPAGTIGQANDLRFY